MGKQRYSKQMKEFLSFLWQSETNQFLESFRRAREGEPEVSNEWFSYAGWSLQRMAKELYDRGLVVRQDWGHQGYKYYLSAKGKDFVKERKLENYFKRKEVES